MIQLHPSEWPVVYYKDLYSYARFKIADKSLVEDLVQDTLLEALENAGRFERRSSEITWLTAILKYKIYQVYREQSKMRLVYLGQDDLLSLPSRVNNTDGYKMTCSHESLVYKEMGKAIAAFVATLPVKWQLLYRLKFVQEEKSAEICVRLNISENNYWVMTHRLKLSLREWYLKQ